MLHRLLLLSATLSPCPSTAPRAFAVTSAMLASMIPPPLGPQHVHPHVDHILQLLHPAVSPAQADFAVRACQRFNTTLPDGKTTAGVWVSAREVAGPGAFRGQGGGRGSTSKSFTGLCPLYLLCEAAGTRGYYYAILRVQTAHPRWGSALLPRGMYPLYVHHCPTVRLLLDSSHRPFPLPVRRTTAARASARHATSWPC